jgi:hypothetical protein
MSNNETTYFQEVDEFIQDTFNQEGKNKIYEAINIVYESNQYDLDTKKAIIEDLIQEMQSPNVMFIKQKIADTDTRDYHEIEDLYEFIDKVNEDMSLNFVQKNQLIEGRLNNGK